MFGNIGPMELILILGVALMLFGAKRLPELGQSLGKGIREFKRSISSDDRELESSSPAQSSESSDVKRLIG